MTNYLTKPLIFTGKSLTLNFSTSAVGYIRVEVQHENGSPVERLSLEGPDELYGNSIEQVVERRITRSQSLGRDIHSITGFNV